MSGWPDGVTVGSIRDWPGQLTPEWKRKPSPFGATLATTLGELDREVHQLVDTLEQQNSVEVLIAIPAEQFRRDGKPFARATARHPGVIVSFDSKHGHLSYPCDTFTTWQANLRAIVLALESLRRVDRYGVTRHGEQYRGFLAIEGASAMGGVDGAVAVLEDLTGLDLTMASRDGLSAAIRSAKRRTHPDVTADPSLLEHWGRVIDAERTLREAGRL